jgi:LmbE family N-acetylglucosaminyl deacetylase
VGDESGGLATVWGSRAHFDRAPRMLGLFAHPDDEVFCVGGTIARCADAGADTAIASLTRGEGGQIRDASRATRRTLGAVRVEELNAAAAALRVGRVTALDLGDGQLERRPLDEVATVARGLIDQFAPDVVVTFGPDGAFGHPDHVMSCLATIEALRTMPEPPRLLHAQFPHHEQLLVDVLVEWLTSRDERFSGTHAFGHALKLFADGSSMLGFAADHLRLDWFPAGSFIIEQGEPATELFCILSGSVDIAVEGEDGQLCHKDSAGAGSFVGEDGLATGRPRNAHVIAHEDVTCLVLSPARVSRSAGRGATATVTAETDATRMPDEGPVPAEAPDTFTVEETFAVDVIPAIERKVAALAAHRTQYAMEADLLPQRILERLLGTEHFAAVRVHERPAGDPAAAHPTGSAA